MKKAKIITLLLAVTLIATCMIAPSMAWVMSESNPVVNTFTYGDIVIKLTETDTGLDDDDDPNTNLYGMHIGQSITKDPKVTVLKDSEASWLIVKLEKENDFDTYLEYTVADGWIQLTDKDDEPIEGVYYRITEKAAEDTEYKVIKDDTVRIRDTVTKDDLRTVSELPKLTITAYAVQYENIDAAILAWELINPADVEIPVQEIPQM